MLIFVVIIAFISNLFNISGYYCVKEREMKLIINGETKIFGENITLNSVLVELALTGKVMAAAVNMNIVKQNKWDEYRLIEGDKIELLDFVGGG